MKPSHKSAQRIFAVGRMILGLFLLLGAGLRASDTDLPARTISAAPGADLFGGGQVLRLRIEVAPAELAELRRDPRDYVSATLVEGTRRYKWVGVRLKGATGSFRNLDDKPSLTLSFDRFVPAQRFHGLRKIHLNNSVEDPSYLNELLGSELFRAAGVPAARTTHAMVDLNGRLLGLCVLKEGFSEDFLTWHFGDANGRLYEPGRGHDVDELLEEKTAGERTDRDELDALVAAVRETDLDQRWQRLSSTLDLERFISFMALEVMLGHRDGYCLARNNFRLYHNVRSGRLVFLPHGMDQLFGRAPVTIEPRMNGLVARAVLETADGRKEYRTRLGNLFTNLFDLAGLHRCINTNAARLRQALPSSDDRALDEAVAELKSRLAKRYADIQKQLNESEAPPLIFQDGGAALSGWRAVDEPAGGVMRQVRSSAGRTELYIRAGPRTSASWRATVRLMPGKYRFEGTVRTARIEPLEFGRLHGAALRIRQESQFLSEAAPFNSEGEKLRVEFEVSAAAEVDLSCELRARGGEAWFDTGSLRLLRVSAE